MSKTYPDSYRRLKCREYALWTWYRLTVRRYDEMVETQSGVCAICRWPETVTSAGKIIALSVDHDHVTGRVRGLLCRRCNNALAFVEDRPWIEAAEKYLNVDQVDGATLINITIKRAIC